MQKEIIDITQLQGFVDKKAKEIRRAVIRATRDATQRGRSYIEETVIPAAKPFPPVDRGLYRNSWKAPPLQDGSRLFSDSPYAAMIEWGRRPGGRFPPVMVMRDWVRRKFQFGKAGKSQSIDSEVNSIAFLISRHIAKNGIPPHHILTGSLPKIREYLKAAIAEQLRGITNQGSEE